MERMTELIEKLNEASKAYYQEDREIMSDNEYDALYDELVRLENETGTVLSGSPTQKVGHKVLSSLVKVRHESPMLSLDKTKDVNALAEFLGGREGVLSWKLDGLSIGLAYKDGALASAVTRGDGEVGEDITHNARFFVNIPLKIRHAGELTLRGEAVITYEDFERINTVLPGAEKYKNPRNLVSGTVRQLNTESAAGRAVRLYVHSVAKAEGAEFDDLRSNQLKWAERLGFQTVGWALVTSENIAETVKRFEQNVSQNPYGTDGLVLSYNSISYGISLGRTAKFPRDSIAFKWRDELKETTLISVQWNTSRTGLINPVAVFSPIELEGTTVNRASLHNVSIMEGLKLGIGDRLRVYKANMIIPQIKENLTGSGTVEIPENCPVCGHKSLLSETGGVKYLFCRNPNCRAQLVRSITHYASRNALNIEGLSEATLEKFIEQGFINNYTDIYRLNRYEQEIKAMEGFGDKSYDNLINSIERSKDTELHRFICGLGIAQVGPATARLLCAHFDNDISRIMAAEPEELIEIEGFGEVIAEAVYEYFQDEANKAAVLDVVSQLSIKRNGTAKAADNTINGLTFVITGDLNRFGNRNELKDLIEQYGGKVTGGVTGKTSFLINNDITSGSSKNKKARELNIPVLTEDDFIERFGLGN